MKLKRKIKNCKRHKQNKKLSIFAEAMFDTSWKAPEFNIFIHPLIFEIIRFNHFGEICGNLRPSEFVDNPFSCMKIPHDIIEFYEHDIAERLKEWCGIPKTCEPFGYGVDKTIFTTSPIPLKPSVSVKEI
jgi:hypothetical protein